jgi:hypothetical protein
MDNTDTRSSRCRSSVTRGNESDGAKEKKPTRVSNYMAGEIHAVLGNVKIGYLKGDCASWFG